MQTTIVKMADAPVDFASWGSPAIKMADWVKAVLIDNRKRIPKKFRPYLMRALQRGFIEDVPRFEAAFNGMMAFINGEIFGNMLPEDREELREGARLMEEAELRQAELESLLTVSHEVDSARGQDAQEPELPGLRGSMSQIPDPTSTGTLLGTLYEDTATPQETYYSLEDVSMTSSPLTVEELVVETPELVSNTVIEDSIELSVSVNNSVSNSVPQDSHNGLPQDTQEGLQQDASTVPSDSDLGHSEVIKSERVQ